MEDNNTNIPGGSTNETPSSPKKPAPEKKVRGRRRLFSDYQYADVKTKSGKTVRRKVYKGKHYGYIIPHDYKKNEAAYIRKIKLTHCLFLLAIIAVWALTSTALNAQGLGAVVYASEIEGYESHVTDVTESSDVTASAIAIFGEKVDVQYFYVLLPYLVCVLPMLLMLMTLVEFVFTGGNRHEQAFMEALTVNLRGQTITLMIAAGVTFIGEVVFIFTNYKVIRSSFTEVGLCALMLCIIGVCILWLGRQEKFKMEEKK